MDNIIKFLLVVWVGYTSLLVCYSSIGVYILIRKVKKLENRTECSILTKKGGSHG